MKKQKTFSETFYLNNNEKTIFVQFENLDSIYQSNLIEIHFPENCLIGERELAIEVTIPDEINRLESWEKLITPVVFISAQKHVTFLRKVIVKLPYKGNYADCSVAKTVATDEKELEVGENHISVSSFHFSPVAVISTKTVIYSKYFFEMKFVFVVKTTDMKLAIFFSNYFLNLSFFLVPTDELPPLN